METLQNADELVLECHVGLDRPVEEIAEDHERELAARWRWRRSAPACREPPAARPHPCAGPGASNPHADRRSRGRRCRRQSGRRSPDRIMRSAAPRAQWVERNGHDDRAGSRVSPASRRWGRARPSPATKRSISDRDRYQAFIDRGDAALGNRSRLAKIVDALQRALCRCGVVKHRDGLRHVLQRGKPRLAEGQVTAELDHIPARCARAPANARPSASGRPAARPGQTRRDRGTPLRFVAAGIRGRQAAIAPCRSLSR